MGNFNFGNLDGEGKFNEFNYDAKCARTSLPFLDLDIFYPLALNYVYASSRGAGFSSRTTHHMIQPIMTFPSAALLGFFLLLVLFFCKVIHEKIKFCNLNWGIFHITVRISVPTPKGLRPDFSCSDSTRPSKPAFKGIPKNSSRNECMCIGTALYLVIPETRSI